MVEKAHIKQMNKAKSWFLAKTHEIYKLIVRLTNWERERARTLTGARNAKECVTTADENTKNDFKNDIWSTQWLLIWKLKWKKSEKI